MQAMADLFALSKIQDEILFRNDEYVSPEKAKAIKRIRSAPCAASPVHKLPPMVWREYTVQ
jgi:hypothetical protein